MADLPIEGKDKENMKETITKTPIKEELKKTGGQVQIIPSAQGNELVVLVQVLASINQNLSFLASTIYNHFNPAGKKNG
jgi:hypothetical protein